jgi:hypothetical protein
MDIEKSIENTTFRINHNLFIAEPSKQKALSEWTGPVKSLNKPA